MRIEQFQSHEIEPIGEGKDRKVFVDPKNEKRVIAEVRQEAEKETPLQLKGKFYLTKLAHLLLPNHIPDIYQAGEDKNGIQTTDSQRIPHTAGQESIQKARRLGHKTTEESRRVMSEEIGLESEKLNEELGRIGLGSNIDGDWENYTRGESGEVYYLESFTPWQVDHLRPNELKVLFDEEILRGAIEKLTDENAKNICLKYLERLLVLLEEEKVGLQQNPQSADFN